MGYLILSALLGPSVPTWAADLATLVFWAAVVAFVALMAVWAIATVDALRPHRPSVAVIVDPQGAARE